SLPPWRQSLPATLRAGLPTQDIDALDHRSNQDEVIARAAAAGVTPLIVTGTSERGSREALGLCAARPGALYCTVGVHPHGARHFGLDSLDALRELAQQLAAGLTLPRLDALLV